MICEKKEKNATKHAAQNVASRDLLRSSCFAFWVRMAGVIGIFCEISSLLKRMMPPISKVFWYLNKGAFKGFGKSYCRWRMRTTFKEQEILVGDNVLPDRRHNGADERACRALVDNQRTDRNGGTHAAAICR